MLLVLELFLMWGERVAAQVFRVSQGIWPPPPCAGLLREEERAQRDFGALVSKGIFCRAWKARRCCAARQTGADLLDDSFQQFCSGETFLFRWPSFSMMGGLQ